MIEHIVVDWRDLLDIGIVSFLLYQVIQLLRGSRALAVVSGLGILTFLYFLSRALGLYTLQWLLDHIFTSLFLVIVVIFQEDIRRALGEMGTKHLFQHKALRASSVEDVASACEESSPFLVSTTGAPWTPARPLAASASLKPSPVATTTVPPVAPFQPSATIAAMVS